MITVLGRFKTITEAREYANKIDLEDRTSTFTPTFIYKGHRGYVVAAKDSPNAQQSSA